MQGVFAPDQIRVFLEGVEAKRLQFHGAKVRLFLLPLNDFWEIRFQLMPFDFKILFDHCFAAGAQKKADRRSAFFCVYESEGYR